MSDWLLENLEEDLKKAEKKIKEAEGGIGRLEEETRLNRNLSAADDYKEKISKEDLESLEYETIALEDIKRWKQSHLEEAQQEKRLLEHKINYRRSQAL